MGLKIDADFEGASQCDAVRDAVDTDAVMKCFFLYIYKCQDARIGVVFLLYLRYQVLCGPR